MASLDTSILSRRVFRTSSYYEVVLFDRLSDEEKGLLGGLARDPDFYGVLRPCGDDGRTLKAVDRETALLLLTQREPGPLPDYVLRQGERTSKDLCQLILDGVLEVDHDGTYVSGSEALEILSPAGPSDEPRGAISRLSMQALRYASALPIDDVHRLSMRLYGFHRVPSSPRWERLLRDVLIYVDGDTRSLTRDLPAEWHGPDSSSGHWLTWSRRGGPPLGARAATYKLYVSPRVELLPEIVEPLVEVLVASTASAFKLGADASGLLRPDKLIVYFHTFEGLAEAGERLSRLLDGTGAHGVPFTAEIGASGLLSWGMDPPRDPAVADDQQPMSWRLWVTNRLALAILEARRGASEASSPWRFAIERLRLEGIDVEDWTPSASIWLAECAR